MTILSVANQSKQHIIYVKMHTTVNINKTRNEGLTQTLNRQTIAGYSPVCYCIPRQKSGIYWIQVHRAAAVE